MPQSFAALYFHFVFSTKDRAPMIAPEIQPRLYEYIGGLCRKRECTLLAAGGMPDHVHLLVSMARDITASAFMRETKAVSSKWLHETGGMKHFLWQQGYGVFSVSVSQLEVVTQYIQNQALHHAKKSFQDEFIELLQRHNIPYDPKTIWL